MTVTTDYYDDGEKIVYHVRWVVDTKETTFRCLNCGARETHSLIAVIDTPDPEKLLYDFTAKHKDCKYEPTRQQT